MIAKDKLQHIALGVIWLGVTLVGLWLYSSLGLGIACAWGTTAYAVLYEINQWYRKEGQPDLLDAICTAAPGFVFWIIWSM